MDYSEILKNAKKLDINILHKKPTDCKHCYGASAGVMGIHYSCDCKESKMYQSYPLVMCQNDCEFYEKGNCRMNKQELMENFTMEQLADKIIALDITINDMKNTEKIIKQYNRKQCECEKSEKRRPFADKELAEKWKELAEELNEKGYKYIEENEELKAELERRERIINQIDDILENLFGVRHDIGKPNEFEEILKEKIYGNITIEDFLPAEPIKVADMLISAEGEYEHTPIMKTLCKTDKGTYKLFEISELRQIAEHLLVYCNENQEDQQ